MRQDQSIFDRAKYPLVTLVDDVPVIDGKQFTVVAQKLNINRLKGKRLSITKHLVQELGMRLAVQKRTRIGKNVGYESIPTQIERKCHMRAIGNRLTISPVRK
ncbi:hypothetical protein WS75_25530 [Burkholderia sp. FL-7-2-10-S1-D7]|nr:hypothetical protein WS75_25530 [Burkholderia sp. FL-7-2-10-S1-D7]